MKKILFLMVFFGFAPKPPVVPIPPAVPGSLDKIISIAKASTCAKRDWPGRGHAPTGYTPGMALVFAKEFCKLKISDQTAGVISQAKTGVDSVDSLSWYSSNFKKIGRDNTVPGLEPLISTFSLLIGLGMRESSGAHCVGRDMSAGFSSSDSAEAGLFQASWGAHTKSSELTKLFNQYSNDGAHCLLSTFKEGAKCPAHDAVNWGTGTGKEFQALSKNCPAFATEYAAVLLRVHGGTKGEFGPIRTKAAEIYAPCVDLLTTVATIIDATPTLCKEL